MALVGFDPAVACERLGHTRRGRSSLRRTAIYEGEKRVQADRLDARVRSRSTMRQMRVGAPGIEWAGR
jgi:hypothetical protein